MRGRSREVEMEEESLTRTEADPANRSAKRKRSRQRDLFLFQTKQRGGRSPLTAAGYSSSPALRPGRGLFYARSFAMTRYNHGPVPSLRQDQFHSHSSPRQDEVPVSPRQSRSRHSRIKPALSRTSSSEIVNGGEMRNAVSQKRNQSLRIPASLKSSMIR